MEYPPELAAAYRAAVYRVETPAGAVDLRIGEGSPGLDRALAAQGERSWAYLTATNPGSRPLPEPENVRRMARLDAELARRGLAAWRGASRDPAGVWPAEPSRLILGIDEGAARALAGSFGQAAFVAGEIGGAPRLVWVAG
jgi:hypothetical protein